VSPGFKVSAAPYVSGLFRPQIIEDLELAKFGLRLIAFDPQALCRPRWEASPDLV